MLTQSAEGGVDTFLKKKRQSLFLHFQGHPEYGAETLLKEYRRDIRRFLNKERETYPTMPKGYFDATGEKLVTDFREAALAYQASEGREELIEGFPDSALVETLQRTWQLSATTIYRNCLRYMVSQRSDMSKFTAISAVPEDMQRKRPALS